MTIINSLASSKGQRGSAANIALAKDIANKKNKSAIRELVENLSHKDKRIQGDCIKVLYETGYIDPELIEDQYLAFLKQLNSKNNRLIWGSMVALATITDLRHEELYDSLESIAEAVAKGSVITIDCGVEILAKLNKYEKYNSKTEPLLIEQLHKCPIKQLPQYIEKSLVSINPANKEIFANIILTRKTECDKQSQVKRLEKALRKIEQI